MNKDLLDNQNFWKIIFLVISGLLLPILFQIIKPMLNSIKYISITDYNILNINSKGMLQLDNKTNIFSNFINHQLTIENKSNMKHAITEIDVHQIIKEETYIPDLQFDGGFYEKFQKYLLMGYNNGNIKSKLASTKLQVFSVEQDTFFENILDELLSEEKSIDSGNVESIFLIDLKKYYSIFESNEKLTDLKIVTMDKNGKEIPGFFTLIRYDRDDKRFKFHPKGSAGPRVEDVPLINITKDVKEATAKTHQILEQGANQISFNILVDRTCILKYKVKVKSGRKVIIDNNNYEVKIRIPKYNQEVGILEGDFYHFIDKNVKELDKHFLYTEKNFKTKNSKLLFDKYQSFNDIYKQN